MLPRIGFSEVIVNSNVSLDSVSRQYLLSVFSMQTRTWPEGQSIRVYILPPQQPEHRSFVKSELKLFPYQLVKIWDRSVFSGSGQSPMIVESEEEMLRKVSENKGAIGYLLKGIEEGDNVKALRIK
ncbi:MAG: hypothetical protein CMI05_03615 [Oceanospirillaceae bacterium]|nr:hypothetical protein [Oceanospirillaceae bacterium]